MLSYYEKITPQLNEPSRKLFGMVCPKGMPLARGAPRQLQQAQHSWQSFGCALGCAALASVLSALETNAQVC